MKKKTGDEKETELGSRNEGEGKIKQCCKKKVNEKVKIDRKGKQRCSEQSCKGIRRTKEEEHRGQGNKCRCDGSEDEKGRGEEKRETVSRVK